MGDPTDNVTGYTQWIGDNVWNDSRTCPTWVDGSRRSRRCRKKKNNSPQPVNILTVYHNVPWLGFGSFIPPELNSFYSGGFFTRVTPTYRRGTTGGADALYYQTMEALKVPGVLGMPPWRVASLTGKTVAWDQIAVPIGSIPDSDLISFLFPHTDTPFLRGLYDVMLNANSSDNPEPAEIDATNIATINHIRHLLGYPSLLDRWQLVRIFTEAQISHERALSPEWDIAYPTDTCPIGSPVTCGSNFNPPVEELIPYYPSTTYPIYTPTGPYQGQEDLLIEVSTSTPWCMKLSEIFQNMITTQSFNGDLQKFLTADKIGIAFQPFGAKTLVRFKFSYP